MNNKNLGLIVIGLVSVFMFATMGPVGLILLGACLLLAKDKTK